MSAVRHTLEELTRIGATTDEMQKCSWIEVIGHMQEVQLLRDDADHSTESGSDSIRFRRASLGIQHVRHPAAHTVGLAFHLGDPMTHRKQQGAVGHVSRQQPESPIAEVENDSPFGQLRGQLLARDDGHGTPPHRLADAADGRRQQRRKGAFGQEAVPRGEEDEAIACARLVDQRLSRDSVFIGGGKSLLRARCEASNSGHGLCRPDHGDRDRRGTRSADSAGPNRFDRGGTTLHRIEGVLQW